ncbi:hypothetical protein D3C72_2023900 [compost metagenome]
MGMPDDHDRRLAGMLDHGRDIACPVVQRLVGKRADAAAIAARLRAEHAITGSRKRLGQFQHVSCAAAERRQQDDGRAGTQLVDLDGDRRRARYFIAPDCALLVAGVRCCLRLLLGVAWHGLVSSVCWSGQRRPAPCAHHFTEAII